MQVACSWMLLARGPDRALNIVSARLSSYSIHQIHQLSFIWLCAAFDVDDTCVLSRPQVSAHFPEHIPSKQLILRLIILSGVLCAYPWLSICLVEATTLHYRRTCYWLYYQSPGCCLFLIKHCVTSSSHVQSYMKQNTRVAWYPGYIQVFITDILAVDKSSQQHINAEKSLHGDVTRP